MSQINFYGSQVGGKVVTPHSYTDSPLLLLRHDVWSALKLYALSPFIVFPLSPMASGHFCELYPNKANIWNIFLHVLLLLMQTPFLLSVPFWLFLPMWTLVVGVSVFWAINQTICLALNGSKLQYCSDPKFAESKEDHKHEQWIFMNGVAVGQVEIAHLIRIQLTFARRHWLKSNVNRLALTFGRPVVGVHSKSNGILFDVIQCLIQRNFNYATTDIRDGYKIVKETLYNPQLSKVIFILHSQGGIEGGMIIDWLLQELPQYLLAKLEVYTFGCAANHFNNPHLHLISQHAALSKPNALSTTNVTTHVHYHDSRPDGENGVVKVGQPNTTRFSQRSSNGKSIQYIEHYAHTSDFVAQWGVLNFISTPNLAPTVPRYMGRVFEHPGKGHQFNQHYLDNMFPLKPSLKPTGGAAGSGFEGAAEHCEFMDSAVQLGQADIRQDEREGFEMSIFGARGNALEEQTTVLSNLSPITPVNTMEAVAASFAGGNGFRKGDSQETRYTVKDLSRLWLYLNGGSPKLDEVEIGIARMATV